jgi:general secretion pathway protein N
MTRERPLFSPSRRPPPSVVVANPSVQPARPAKPAEPDRPLLTLIGTIAGKTQSLGIFIDQVTKNVIHLKTGQDHAGWTLRAIEGREAIFDKDQREVTLALPVRGAARPGDSSVTAAIPVAARSEDVWMDGDGQLIGLPPHAKDSFAAPAASPSVWTDGDGQVIAAPAAARSAQH